MRISSCLWTNLVCLALILVSGSCLHAQVRTDSASGRDSTQVIQLIHSDSLWVLQQDSQQVTKLKGNVLLVQGATTFSCDSALQYTQTNIVDAYGHIHINDADSVNTYGDSLHYLGDQKLATLRQHVLMTDGKMTLTTNLLDYDLNTHIGIYRDGGQLVNGSTTLTSRRGYYDADTREAYFKNQVHLVDTQYTLEADSLQYNTENHTARFVVPTRIHNGESRILTSDGYYDTDLGQALFASRSVIIDSSQTITADSLFYFKRTGLGVARGNVIWNDTSDQSTVYAQYATTNEHTREVLATRHPVLEYRMKSDTLYLSSDTLFSGLSHPGLGDTSVGISDSIGRKGTRIRIPGKTRSTDTTDTHDSTAFRYFLSYHRVRIYSDSLQGVCDSLYYSFEDSTFRFYQDPIVWIGNNQLNADTILLLTRNRQANRLDLIRQALIIDSSGPELFNQIQGSVIHGYFEHNQLNWMHVNGNAESIYYAQDDSGAYIGVNRAICSVIDIYFKNKELDHVLFRERPVMTFNPVRGLNPADYRLRGFSWQQKRRPESRMELLRP